MSTVGKVAPTENINSDKPPEEDGPSNWSTFRKFMVIWAVLAHFGGILQIIKVYGTEDAGGLSAPAYMIYMLSACMWFTYGWWAKGHIDKVVVTSAVLGLAISTMVFVGIMTYGGDEKWVIY